MNETAGPEADGAGKEETLSVNEKRWLIWAFVVAVSLRTLYLVQNAGNPLLYTPVLDEAYYIGLGKAIAGGFWAGEKGVFFMDPLYGYFLAFFFFSSGLVSSILGVEASTDAALMAVRVFQILLDSSLVFLIFLLGWRVGDKRAGLFAAWFWAVYKVAFFYTLLILKITVSTFAVVFFTLALIKAAEERKSGWWLGVGALAGVLTFIRANLLLMAPFGLLAWLLASRPKAREFAAASALLGAGFIAILSIGAARNYLVSGQWIFLNSQSGRLLYASNNPQNLSGLYQSPSFSRTSPMEMEKDFHREAERRTGKSMTAKEVSSYWTGETLAFMASQPLDAATAIYNKAKGTLGNFEIPINRSYYSNEEFSWLARAPLPNFAFLLALGLPGLVASVILGRKGWWLYPGVATILATVLIFHTCSRYRFPMTPLLAVGAGISFSLLIRWGWEKAWARAGGLLALALALGVLSASIEGRKYQGDAEYFLAKAYWNVGDLKKARDIAFRSAKAHPSESRFLVLLGMVELSRRNFVEAARLNKLALKVNPHDSDAMNNLGLALSQTGGLDEAIHWLSSSFAANNNPLTLLALARVHEKKGDAAAAIEMYRRFVKISKPGSQNIHRAQERIRALGGG